MPVCSRFSTIQILYYKTRKFANPENYAFCRAIQIFKFGIDSVKGRVRRKFANYSFEINASIALLILTLIFSKQTVIYFKIPFQGFESFQSVLIRPSFAFFFKQEE